VALHSPMTALGIVVNSFSDRKRSTMGRAEKDVGRSVNLGMGMCKQDSQYGQKIAVCLCLT
jgi:hypothetical protein